MHLLVIEDEAKVAEALREGLEQEGYAVTLAGTAEDGLFEASEQAFDLILLDLMLPGRSGMELLATLRRREDRTPVLILTAKDAVEHRVRGLNEGADDYLVKPFAFPELLARIRALLRRGREGQALQLRCADLEMDLAGRVAKRGGTSLDLTPREGELLEYLLRHKDQVVSRDMLARDVWEQTERATPIDNVIEVQIARLREKVDQPFDRPLIHTVRGVGYLLSDDPPSEPI